MRKNKSLFWSLCLYFLVPFLYSCIRTSLLSGLPSTEGLGIAGHIEWFDLINETLQAFLIVPFYKLFSDVLENKQELSNRIRTGTLVSTAIYTVFSAIVLLTLEGMVGFMAGAGAHQDATISYLRWETIGFVVGHLSSVAVVVFVVLGKSKYVFGLTVLKTLLTVVGDIGFIPFFGVNGVAYSNIMVNALISLLCVVALCREGLPTPQRQTRFSQWLKEYAKIGLFSGGQIFLDNLIYALIVCRMVNAVEEQGTYWVANNFIWGLLLVPTMALAEIIKRDGSVQSLRSYFKTTLCIAGAWLISIPLWRPFIAHVMGVQEYEKVASVVLTLLPFYIAYGVSSVFASVFVAKGKTQYNFVVSIIVNILYYGIVYTLFLNGVFSASLTFICCMFGFGMVVNALCSVGLYYVDTKILASRQKQLESKT